jgi:antitoxin ChpS
MHTTNLRKVGGSIMLAVPPALLDLLNLKAGTSVGIDVEGGRLIVKPTLGRRYTLDELLAASDYSVGPSQDDLDWIDGPAIGKEIL